MVHELSIMAEVFEIIEKKIMEYNLKSISKVILRIGEMTCVEEDAMRFAFEAFAHNTRVEDAVLIINKIEATALCPTCSKIFRISFINKLCPVCNTYSNNIISGEELSIESLEGEDCETD